MLRIFVSATRASAISAAVLVGLVFTGVGRGAPDPACTVEVTTGHSIQDAINSASSGATICVGSGTYQENLLIAKDGITLKGAGPGITVLEPPAKPLQVCVELLFASGVDYEIFNGVSGICVANVDAEGHELGVVNDVRVTGFTIHAFEGAGIVFANTNRPRADHNLAANNHDYGITAYHSTHGRFEYNTSYGSHDAGFYVGVSPDADFTVQDNAAFDDLWGVLIRDSSTGRVRDNLLYGSCAGLVFWNTGITTGVHNWRASHNIAASNNNSCPANETGLPFTLTGLGILIAGGDHIVLRENRVRENQPLGDTTTHGVPLFTGGIVVVSTADISAFPGFYGSDASHNIIFKNTVLHNRPFDLVYDERGTRNHFVFNRCETSSPDGLCRGEKSEH
jgi:nitrous oxidase accessory protein NosD